MADTKISALASAGSLTGTETLPLVQSSATKKVLLSALATYINSLVSGGASNNVVTIIVTDPNGDDLAVGDGQSYYRVPSKFNGMNLAGVAGALVTASSSGAVSIQIANVTDGVDMLLTELTIDATETDSSTAAAAAAVDPAHEAIATADMLRIDVDAAGTGAKGLIVELQFA